jgi:hypothetical protein
VCEGRHVCVRERHVCARGRHVCAWGATSVRGAPRVCEGAPRVCEGAPRVCEGAPRVCEVWNPEYRVDGGGDGNTDTHHINVQYDYNVLNIPPNEARRLD